MTSAQRKLARGVEQVEALRRETLAFESDETYVLRTERDPRSAEEVEYRCFAVEREATPDHWPLLAGEAIHNLRSALDNAIYAASKGRGRTQFPIFLDSCEFQVLGRPMIARAPKPVRALVEARQPYNALPEHPRIDALAILRDLSNLDKHRALATVACAVEQPYVGVDDKETDLVFTDVGFNRPLHDDTPVLAFVVRGPNAHQMNVDPKLIYQVAIEGRPLAGTLVAIAQRVFECVTECETGEAISPFAHYPIYPAGGRVI